LLARFASRPALAGTASRQEVSATRISAPLSCCQPCRREFKSLCGPMARVFRLSARVHDPLEPRNREAGMVRRSRRAERSWLWVTEITPRS
jgi:hypothetical protein